MVSWEKKTPFWFLQVFPHHKFGRNLFNNRSRGSWSWGVLRKSQVSEWLLADLFLGKRLCTGHGDIDTSPVSNEAGGILQIWSHCTDHNDLNPNGWWNPESMIYLCIASHTQVTHLTPYSNSMYLILSVSQSVAVWRILNFTLTSIRASFSRPWKPSTEFTSTPWSPVRMPRLFSIRRSNFTLVWDDRCHSITTCNTGVNTCVITSMISPHDDHDFSVSSQISSHFSLFPKKNLHGCLSLLDSGAITLFYPIFPTPRPESHREKWYQDFLPYHHFANTLQHNPPQRRSIHPTQSNQTDWGLAFVTICRGTKTSASPSFMWLVPLGASAVNTGATTKGSSNGQALCFLASHHHCEMTCHEKIWCLKFHVLLKSSSNCQYRFMKLRWFVLTSICNQGQGFSLLHLPAVRRRTVERGRRKARCAYDTWNKSTWKIEQKPWKLQLSFRNQDVSWPIATWGCFLPSSIRPGFKDRST